MADFHVGAQVVCINDKWPPELAELARRFPPRTPSPVVGTVYTISAIHWGNPAYDDYGPSIELVELPYLGDEFWEPGFCGCDFRPVRKTDISCFTKLLAPTPRSPVEVG